MSLKRKLQRAAAKRQEEDYEYERDIVILTYLCMTDCHLKALNITKEHNEYIINAVPTNTRLMDTQDIQETLDLLIEYMQITNSNKMICNFTEQGLYISTDNFSANVAHAQDMSFNILSDETKRTPAIKKHSAKATTPAKCFI